MQVNISKSIEKIFTELCKLNSLTKTVIRHGIHLFFALLILGVAIVIYNHVKLSYDAYVEFIATSIIKSSFTILAEIVIGALLVDYLYKKA